MNLCYATDGLFLLNEPFLCYRLLVLSMTLNDSDSFPLHLMKMSLKCVKMIFNWSGCYCEMAC